MDFQGKLIEILPAVKGESARGAWERQMVIFEQAGKQYNKEVAVLFVNKADEVKNLKVGMDYTVSIDIESRKWQERWYTDIRAWRVQPLQQEASAAPDMPPFEEEPQYASSPAAGVVDDMPF